MRKKVLITGINGFLGSHLAKELKSNYEVVGLEYSLDNLFRIASENFEVYSSSKDALNEIFIKHDFYAVIHVATVYRRQSEPMLDLLKTNIVLPVQLLELSGQHEVPVFINTDSFFNNSEYSYSYLSDYTMSKKHSVDWIQLMSATSSTKVVNLKIFHMYGEFDAPTKFIPFLIQKISSNEAFIEMTPGEQTRDFIYVKDVVKAYRSVIESIEKLDQYGEFHVGTGTSYSIKDIANEIKDVTASNTDLRFGALAYRQGEIMASVSDNSSLLQLGWKPEFTLREALTQYIANDFSKSN